jgi:hypothetical protein
LARILVPRYGIVLDSDQAITADMKQVVDDLLEAVATVNLDGYKQSERSGALDVIGDESWTA